MKQNEEKFNINKDVVTVFVQINTKIKCWKSIHIIIKRNKLGKTTNKIRKDTEKDNWK